MSNNASERSEDRGQPKPKRAVLPTVIGAFLLTAAFAGGVLFNVTADKPASEPTPAALETIAPTAVPTPTPTPTVSAIRLYAFGRELDADGFTAYVGDRPFMLSAEVEPAIRQPQVVWTISDSASASLTPSGDSMSCEFTALKPSGKNELTVRCYGAETTIPVYLWER